MNMNDILGFGKLSNSTSNADSFFDGSMFSPAHIAWISIHRMVPPRVSLIRPIPMKCCNELAKDPLINPL